MGNVCNAISCFVLLLVQPLRSRVIDFRHKNDREARQCLRHALIQLRWFLLSASQWKASKPAYDSKF
jgi:hypothetical protein